MIQRRVTGHDFNLFHAIVGSQPIMEPTAAEEAVCAAMAAVPAPIEPQISPLRKKIRAAMPARPNWSAAAIVLQVRGLCQRRIGMRINRPQFAHWLRHVSDEAIKRIDEAQHRLSPQRIPTDEQREEIRRAA